MTTNQLAYNPDDPLQQAFLSALAGSSSYSPNGASNTYGFSSGEWSSLSSTYGLNAANPTDQSEGAWYLAQQDYATQTGGSLEGALQSGQISSIQSALANLWPSVQGNQANPQGLGSAIGGYISQFTALAPAPSGSGAASDGSSAASSGIGSLFQRGGLLIVGGVVIAVAIWALFKKETG